MTVRLSKLEYAALVRASIRNCITCKLPIYPNDDRAYDYYHEKCKEEANKK